MIFYHSVKYKKIYRGKHPELCFMAYEILKLLYLSYIYICFLKLFRNFWLYRDKFLSIKCHI